ncbi:glycosyltransferase family 39 protein [bacterium SCSIO 12741]|nr:glycosyltransferase family 39 protein [bacterium SCSIO 12741]
MKISSLSPSTKLLLSLGIVLLFTALFGANHILGLQSEEPRRAIVSLEMVNSGNYVVPSIHGWSYYNKPPVFNWWMALYYKLFQSYDEWVVRIPSLVALLLSALLIFRIGRPYLRSGPALLAAAFLLSSAEILFYGSILAGEIDLFFALLSICQMLSIFWFFEKKKYLQLFIWSYFFAALGTLTKGPPSIAFQALTLLPWILIHRRWTLLFSWKHFAGLGVYVLAVGGYFWLYSFYDDPLPFMVRLFKEASQRSGAEHAFSDTLVGFLTFPLKMLAWMAPWSLFLVFLFKKKVWSDLWANPLLKFCLVALVFNLPIYALAADIRPRYLYPLFPFFFLIIGHLFGLSFESLKKWKTTLLQILGAR